MAVDYCFSSYDPLQQQDQYEDEELDQQQEEEEDEYIDMEVSSYYSKILKSSPIHHQANEFEFSTQSGRLDRDPLSTTSPADELFYKGKLLPLHLPPRLQVMQTLLQNHSSPCIVNSVQKDFYTTPNSCDTPATATPFLSCNASPAESCQVSRELNPVEYFLECSNEEEPKKSSWARKLKSIKQSPLLNSKIKASRAYFKYLFGKSSGSKDDKDPNKSGLQQAKTLPNQQSIDKETKHAKFCHRRSFSGAFKLRGGAAPKTKTLTSSSSSGSSSSSSSNSNGSNEVQVFKRSSSANSELESAIAGAIAHCKKSQSQVFRSRKTLSEIGL